MKKFKIPETEHRIIELKDYINFKPKKINAEASCQIALKILEELELSDLATYFSPVYNAMVDIKLEENAKKKDETPTPPSVA